MWLLYFLGTTTLKSHMFHTKEKLYQCSSCDFFCTINSNLKRHQKNDCRTTGKNAVCTSEHDHVFDIQKFQDLEEAQKYANNLGVLGKDFYLKPRDKHDRSGIICKAYCSQRSSQGCPATWSIREERTKDKTEFIFKTCRLHSVTCMPEMKGKKGVYNVKKAHDQLQFPSYKDAMDFFYDNELDVAFNKPK